MKLRRRASLPWCVCVQLLFTAAACAQPSITQVVGLYTNQSGPIAPGEPIRVIGTNLATGTGSCGAFGNLPSRCQGAALFVGASEAPISFAAPTEIDCIVPFELDLPSTNIFLSVNGQQTTFDVTIAPAVPAFTGSSFVDQSFQTYTVAHPANPGDRVQGFAVGLGITNPVFPDGQPPPDNPVSVAIAALQLTVGGVPATVFPPVAVTGSTLAYQVQFVVPAGLSGNQPVVLTADGVSTKPVTLPIAGSATALSVATGSNLGTFELGEVQVALAANGGNGGYVWTLASGALPPGLSIRGDMPAWITPYAPEGLIGVATTPGTYHFTLDVTSGAASTSQAFTMIISPLKLIDGPTLPDADFGRGYYGPGYQLKATRNGNAVQITCTPTSVSGISLSSKCLVSGEATANGTLTIPVTYTDGTDTLQRSLSLHVSEVLFGNLPFLDNAVQHSAYSVTLFAVGGTPPYTLSFAGGSLPAGLSFDGTTISGTPTAPPGKYNFVIAISDSQSHSVSQRVAIDVLSTPAMLPQIFEYGDLTDCTLGVTCSRVIGVTGGTAPYFWIVSGLPAGMSSRYNSGNTLSSVDPGDLELFGAPTSLGVHNITLTVLDANGVTVTQTIPFRVSPLLVDSCVSATSCPGLPDGSVDTEYAATLRVVGGTPPYTAALQSSAIGAGRLPFDLWLGATAVTGTPFEDGAFSPLLSISDSAGTPNLLTTSTSIHISGDNPSTVDIAPVPTQYISQGQPYSLQLTACCAAGYIWTQSSGIPPGGIGLSGSGLISGTTSAPPGMYSLIATVKDSGNAVNQSTRLITFAASAMSITTPGTLVTAITDKPYSQPLTVQNGTGIVRWSLGPGQLLPPGLSLSISGSLSGTPAQTGGYTFHAFANDSEGHTIDGNFTLSVYGACDIDANGKTDTSDAVAMLNQALGKAPFTNDLTADNTANVVDLQNVVWAASGGTCTAIFH